MKPRELADLGEFGFLRSLLPTLAQTRGVVVGPGDDCAVVRGAGRLVLTTDALVENVHFRRDWLSPAQIGAKAILVNFSDVAAMGGRPRFVLLSVGVPPDFGRAELARLHRGAERVARRAAAAIVGGNLSVAEQLFVSVAVIGEAKRPVLRSGAKPGDRLFVTGTLGDAAAAVALLGVRRGFRPGPPQDTALGAARRAAGSTFQRFAAPTPRLETGRRLAEAGLASAMIDVSDGLLQDLGHICAASHVGAVVYEENVPRSRAYERLIGPDAALALNGGEDYELLFAVPRARWQRFERLRARLPDPISFIGEIVPRPGGVRVQDRHGKLRRVSTGGFEHFKLA